MANIAAIDIGSNAIRLLIASVDNENNYQQLLSLREPIRLGKDVFSNGQISDNSIKQCCSLFEEFKKSIDSFNVKSYRAVATSALRDAKNQKDFVKQINAACGINIKVIPGLEEARLINLAISKKINLKGKIALLVDIGGGSVEISITSDGNVISTDSLNIGTVRFLQVLEKKKKGRDIFDRLLKSYAKRFRRRVKKYIGKKKIDFLAASGGTIDSLGIIGKIHFEEKSDSKLNSKTLEKILPALQNLSTEERMLKYNLRPDRADVIVPSIIILNQIVKQTNIEEILIPGVGLKEGILHDIISNGVNVKALHLKRAELVSFARELGNKFDYDEQHAKIVSYISLQIFEKTQKLHNLEKEYGVMLELAAVLHDIGSQINADSHHKHSQYIIRSSNFIGLSEVQRNIVACITRYHRKSSPKMEHVEYASLAPRDRKAVKMLSSILRIAEVLSSDETIIEDQIKVYTKPGKVFLKILPAPDLILQKITLKSQIKPFEEVFGVRLFIR